MVYRRLGRSGLQVSVLSFGSWVSFDNQMKDDLAMECMQTAYDAGCNFFDNAEAYAGGESEAIMGRVIQELGWKRHTYVLSSKFFWGLDAHPEHDQHAQPQVPHAGHRRLARALGRRLPRPRLLPSRRSEHADRRDGVGDARHRLVGQGAVLGHQRVDGRRDPCRVGDRRASPPPQAGDGAAAVQPARSPARSRRSTPGCTPTSVSARRSGARWRRVC